MRWRCLLFLAAIAMSCCGNAQEAATTEANSATEPDAEGEAATREAPTPPENPPPIECAESSALIALLRTSMPLAPSDFSEEMTATCPPGQLQPLVGMTRDEMIAQLGEPNAGENFQSMVEWPGRSASILGQFQRTHRSWS